MTIDTEQAWRIEEDLKASGERKLYIRIPDAGSISHQPEIQIQRSHEPPFLGANGWDEEIQPIAAESVFRDGKDLLFQLGDDYADFIDDFEPIEIKLVDTEFESSLAWEIEPHQLLAPPDDPKETIDIPEFERPKPTLNLSADKISLVEGETITLSWQSERAATVMATGAWQGRRANSGSETIRDLVPGEHLFEMTAQNEHASVNQTVSVTVQKNARTPEPVQKHEARGQASDSNKLLLGIIGLLIFIILTILVWFLLFNQDTDPSNTFIPENKESQQPPVQVAVPTDPFEKMVYFTERRQYDDAFKILNKLTGNGHSKAALYAAELAGGPSFRPGLFNERNDNVALIYYRTACIGNAGARQSLLNWQSELQHEAQNTPSDRLRELTSEKIPAVLNNCRD